MPPELMPAAVYVGEGKIAVEHVAIPHPGPGEVLVEIAECGSAGQISTWCWKNTPSRARSSATNGWVCRRARAHQGQPGRLVNAVGGRPISGMRHAPGPAAAADLRCACAAHRATSSTLEADSACYKTVAVDNVLLIPDSLSTRAAAAAEPTAIVLDAVRAGDVGPNDRVLVTGGGPVGLLDRRRLAHAGRNGHHGERALAHPAGAGPGRRGHQDPDTRCPGGSADGSHCHRTLCGCL